MKTRKLTIHRISPATLAALLQRVQCLRYKNTGYFLLNEHSDWFIILYTLRHRGVIRVQHRWPFAAFIRWATAQQVKWYITMPSVQHLCRMTHFAELSTAPWQHPNAPTHTIKKWRDLYHHFGLMIDKAIIDQNKMRYRLQTRVPTRARSSLHTPHQHTCEHVLLQPVFLAHF